MLFHFLSRLILNAVYLKINNVKVKTEDGDTFASKDVIYLPELEATHFLFAKTLPASNATLEMDFSGELNDKMKGFYRSKYLGGSEERFNLKQQTPNHVEMNLLLKPRLIIFFPSQKNVLAYHARHQRGTSR